MESYNLPLRENPGRKKSSLKKIQFAFSESALQKLESLVERSDAVSKTELIRDAILIYEWIFNYTEQGFHISAKRGNEEFRAIFPTMFSIQNIENKMGNKAKESSS